MYYSGIVLLIVVKFIIIKKGNKYWSNTVSDGATKT